MAETLKKKIVEYGPEEMVLGWNMMVQHNKLKLPRVLGVGPQRRRKCLQRLKEKSAEDWAVIFSKIPKSEFLNGGSHSGWQVTFDWLISNEINASKVLEGNYDGTKTAKVGTYQGGFISTKKPII